MKSTLFILVTFIMFFQPVLEAQDQLLTELHTFLIQIENTEEGVRLISEKGCAWKELSFTLQPGNLR